jgi:threonine/homoserine/homoserine lactone efflux protein
MLAALLFGLIGLAWMVTGVVMLANPAWWSDRIRRWMRDPLPRFVLTQGMMLSGLILVVGGAAQPGSWLWVTVGVLLVVMALGLLGISAPGCGRLLDRWARGPLWANRVAGMTLVVLAVLLLIETWRGGR